ncbi:hypothetical protein TNCV_2376901 [Trichonephila clavipes]|nr:hypothetical protein TNCV_2376901 [Trichonephila clavipes]
MHHSSTSERPQQVIVRGIVHSCGHVGLITTDTNGCVKANLVCWACSSKATTIRSVRSSTAATGVSYTSDFRWPQKKKSKGLRSGEHAGTS